MSTTTAISNGHNGAAGALAAYDHAKQVNHLSERIGLVVAEVPIVADRAGTADAREDLLAVRDELSSVRRRLRAIAARAGTPPVEDPARLLAPVEIGGLSIEPAARRVTVNGETLEVPNKEFALLTSLAREPDRVFTKEELLRDLWGAQGGSTRTLESHACRLRARLARVGGRFVVNVWGVGYRLVDR